MLAEVERAVPARRPERVRLVSGWRIGSPAVSDDAEQLDGDERPLDERVTQSDLLRWSEALAGIARTGLGFTESLYEQERFEEVLAVAADIRVAAGFALDADDVVNDWLRQVGQGVAGYVTPKVAVAAVVGNDDGEILLVQRADSGVWLYPTGLGRRRLLGVRGRREGGARGDRHRVRAAAPPRRARRAPPRLHPGADAPADVPLPGDRRRAAAPPARVRRPSGGSPRTTCRGRSPAPASGPTGLRRPPRRDRATSTSTRPGSAPGASDANVRWTRRRDHVDRSPPSC